MQALRVNINTKSKKTSQSAIETMVHVKENAAEQSAALMAVKTAFLREGLLGIFVQVMHKPLEKSEVRREEKDNNVIELVLHLLRNLLCITPVSASSALSPGMSASVIHQSMIEVFEKELVLDIMVFVGEAVEGKKWSKWNLIVMEVLHYLLKDQDPEVCARVALGKAKPSFVPLPHAASSSTSSARVTPTAEVKGGMRAPSNLGSLSSCLKAEKAKLSSSRGPSRQSRHSRFGGTLKSLGSDLTTPAFVDAKADARAPHRRKSKQVSPFLPASSPPLPPLTQSSESSYASLGAFLTSFMSKCYGPLMKTLKDEFRRDSGRLEEGDKVVFFRLISFFR